MAWHGLSLVAPSYSLLRCAGFSLQWLLSWNTGSRGLGFHSCGMKAQELRCLGLAALQYVESSQTRDRTRISCINSWIVNHWTAREVHSMLSFKS